MVQKGGKWGFIDKIGKEIVPFKYSFVSWETHFSDGTKKVRNGFKWGFIDKKGQQIIPTIYKDVEVFCEGLAIVNDYNKRFYIDKKGIEYWSEE